MKLSAVITLLLLSFLLTPPLCAQNSYSEFERGLNLSESQKRRAEGVRQKYIEEWRAQRQETLRKRFELNELRKNPSQNTDRIERTQRELRDIERLRERSYDQYRADLSQVLNERQRQQYNQFTEWERKKRVPPQGFRGTEIQRPEPPGQGPPMPDRRGFETRERRGRGREMKGYAR